MGKLAALGQQLDIQKSANASVALLKEQRETNRLLAELLTELRKDRKT